MGRFRFSVTTFLVVVTMLAAGLAAFVSQSRLGASAAYTAFLALLCLATAGAILSRTERRAFWVGFAIFGWIYWCYEFRESPNSGGGIASYYISWTSSPSPRPSSTLLTTELLALIEERLSVNRKVGSQVMAQWRGGGYYAGEIIEVQRDNYLVRWLDGSTPQWTAYNLIQPAAPQVRVTGHAIMGSLWALGGGTLATVLFGGLLASRRTIDRDTVTSTAAD
jgi:hypothetical protein